jgi:pilus assembly protein Flp/PilA
MVMSLGTKTMKVTQLRHQSGQGMVEYALILALVALIVIVALIATGGQVTNLYSDIIRTMRGVGL